MIQNFSMARISKNPLDNKAYRQVLNTLDLVLGKLKKEEVRHFLFSLLGKNERIMVAKRFTAILLLKQGMKISEIARMLKMTKNTVSKLNMVMRIKNQGFDLAFKKLSQEKMKEDIKQILLGLGKETADIFLNWRIKPPNDYPGKK